VGLDASVLEKLAVFTFNVPENDSIALKTKAGNSLETQRPIRRSTLLNP